MLQWYGIITALVAIYFVRYYFTKQIPTVPNKIWPIYSMVLNGFSMRLWTQWLMRKYEDIVYMERPDGVACMVFRPEWTKIVLTTFTDRALMNPIPAETFGFPGLAMLTGDTWAFHRKIIAPPLLGRSLKPFECIMEDKVHSLVSRFQNTIKKEGGKATIEIYLLFRKLSLDVMSRIVCGVDTDSLQDKPESVAFQKELDFVFEEVVNRAVIPFPYWKVFPFLPSVRRVNESHKLMGNFASKAVEQHKRKPAKTEDSDQPDSFLDVLWDKHLLNKEDFSEFDVLRELLSVLLGGAESIANALSAVFYCLGQHNDVVQKIREEINKLATPGSPIKVADLGQYTYTQWVIKETMRMYPVAYFTDRTAETDITLGPYVIPAGVKILMPPIAIHYNPTLFKDPYTFNPERWANGEPPAGYIPFGGGLRLCVGKSLTNSVMMLTILELYRNLSFSHVTKVPEIMQCAEAFNLRPPNAKLDMLVQKL